VFVTGTKEEETQINEFLARHPEAVNLCGKLSLKELAAFISESYALVAASTGPLHIAAALGIKAIGLFAPMRPIHPGRWAPLGKQAEFVVLDKNCNDCRKGGDCKCMKSIQADEVYRLLG
jgi:ADP-heptose:LPS heptosyltransferase